MMYTVVPLEKVFEGIENIQAPEEIIYNGVTMQVELLDRTQARIVRLISPNPSDYLNAEYAPGTIIRL